MAIDAILDRLPNVRWDPTKPAPQIQGGLIGRLVKKYGEKTLLVTGTIFICLGMFLVPVVGRFAPYVVMLPLAALMACGTGMVNPSLSSLLSQAVNVDEQGDAMGTGQSLAAIGRVLGPAVSGTLFEINLSFPFWLGATLLLACASVAIALRRHGSTGAISTPQAQRA